LEVFIMPRNGNDKSSFTFDGFEGFETPKGTYTPDVVFDVLAPNLKESELRVLLYIIRRTYGFKKDSDNISISQMSKGIQKIDGKVLDYGTGMTKQGVIKGVAGLLEKGIVVAQRNRSREKGDEATTYTLRFKGDPVSTRITRGGKPKRQGGVNDVDTQVTVEQGTVLQETEYSNNFELQTQKSKDISTFGNSKNQFEFLKNDESEGEAAGDEPQERGGGDNQPQTPSTNGFTAIGDVGRLKGIGTDKKPSPRRSKTASGTNAKARAGDRRGRGKSDLPEPPEWLVEHITRYSDELHDMPHLEANIRQAHNLFLYTGAEAQRFADRLNEAKRTLGDRDILKKAEGEMGDLFGQRNKMPYFFKVLRDVLGLKDIPASETKPKTVRRRGKRGVGDGGELLTASAPP
jgi:hypothetical protein